MAVSLISTRLLEMGEVQENRHFQISKAISTDMKAGPAGRTSRILIPCEVSGASTRWPRADRDHAGKQRTLRPFPAPAQGADSGRSAHYDPHSQRGEDASRGLTHYRAPNNPLKGQNA
jgi:hypothetical protein